MIARRLTIGCFMLPLFAARAGAQEPAAAGPRTIVGVVADSAGNPVDSAEVYLLTAKRRTVAKADGSFRFDDVKPGNYQVSARRLGYFPQVRTVRVADAGGVVTFRLVRTAYGLPPVVTTSTRPGLSGVVGDTAYNIVSGAEVSVLATDRRTRSDSTGAFYLDVKPGNYVVQVTRSGYLPRMASVTVPADSGRRIVVWLTPSSAASASREAFRMEALNGRLLRRNPVWSKILTREDIARTGITDATQLATVAAGKTVSDNCVVTIDGGPFTAPLWTFTPGQLEMMEVYTSSVPRVTIAQQTAQIFGGRGPDTRGAPPPINPDCGVAIYAWLRK